MLMVVTSALVFSIDKEPEQKSNVVLQDLSQELDVNFDSINHQFEKKDRFIAYNKRISMSVQFFYPESVTIPDKNKLRPDRLILNIHKRINYI